MTPEEIEKLQTAFTKFSTDLESFLIDQIVRSITKAGKITEDAAYQIYKSRELGIAEQALTNELKKRLNMKDGDIRQLYQDAAYGSYKSDLKRLGGQPLPLEAVGWLQDVLSGSLELTNGTLENITQTLGFVFQGRVLELGEAYRQACDYAFEKTITGTQDYLSAVAYACDGLYKLGIRTIDYESGVHTSLEAAVRRSLIGGLGLVNEQIEHHISEELGTDGWEITAHENSAPDHEPIQGLQYSNEEYERLNNSLVRRIGTLNCGHAAFPIMMGQPPQYSPEDLERMRSDNAKGHMINGRHYTGYEATQKQREFERAIRYQSRKLVGYKAAGDTERASQTNTKILELKRRYNAFSEEAELRRQPERFRISK